MAMPQTITSLYVWIATERDGGEGVPATRIFLEGVPMMAPLLGADLMRIESLEGQARIVKQESGARMRLCRFDLVEEIREL